MLQLPSPRPGPASGRGQSSAGHQGRRPHHLLLQHPGPQLQIRGHLFLLHSELRLSCDESGTECSIETGPAATAPRTPAQPRIQDGNHDSSCPELCECSSVQTSPSLPSMWTMNPELAELSHTNYAIVTPFRVFFVRFIFWVSRYYLFSCLYNWAGVGARNWAEVCRTLCCALCGLSFLIL